VGEKVRRVSSAGGGLAGSLDGAPLPCERHERARSLRAQREEVHTCNGGGIAAAPVGADGSGGRRGQGQADVAAARVEHESAHARGVAQQLDHAGGGGGHLAERT
jgi:hypothetical protein